MGEDKQKGTRSCALCYMEKRGFAERRNGSASEEIGIAAFLFSFPFFVFASRYEASLRDIIWRLQDSHWPTILQSV